METVNPPVNYPKLLDERCRGKKDLAARLLRNLMEDSGPRWLDEVDGFLESGDMESVARMGHSIKGSCKLLYAGPMVSAAMNLEDAGRQGSRVKADGAYEDLKIAFSKTSQWLRENPHYLE